MRRKDREVTDYMKMLEILAGCDCCRIGLVDEGKAYIVPLNFGYENKDGKLTLYFHSANEGKKLDLIHTQSTISFEMDKKHALIEGPIACDYSYNFECIMGQGHIQILDDFEEKVYGLEKIMAHYTKGQTWTFKEAHVNAVTVFKLEVTTWSCKVH